jgi:hypothetical protein
MTVQFEATAINGQIFVPIQYRDSQTDDGFGSLSKYANPEFLAKENSAWELAMRDKTGFKSYFSRLS